MVRGCACAAASWHVTRRTLNSARRTSAFILLSSHVARRTSDFTLLFSHVAFRTSHIARRKPQTANRNPQTALTALIAGTNGEEQLDVDEDLVVQVIYCDYSRLRVCYTYTCLLCTSYVYGQGLCLRVCLF